MTDNEIIKALKHCLTDLDCLECPYIDYDEDERCDEKLLNDLCDLINRQKAEIKALQMDNKQLETDNFNANINCEHLQAEIERFEECASREMLYEKAKAEAVKELLDKLIKEYGHHTLNEEISIDAIFCSIKHIVKEMVGDTDEM